MHAKTMKFFLQFFQIRNKTVMCNYNNILNMQKYVNIQFVYKKNALNIALILNSD